MKQFFVYILKCSDGSYYIGITNDLQRRLYEHQNGLMKGYTSRKLPVELVFTASFTDVNEAIRFEKQIKGWSRKKKEALIKGDFELLKALSKKKK
ncbi:MAG: GIY-YIG nuclease family protein [Ignavibacteria bacterium]|nr:GIY-YIG nuclease family protein [Ignavibacteria bacterium]